MVSDYSPRTVPVSRVRLAVLFVVLLVASSVACGDDDVGSVTATPAPTVTGTPIFVARGTPQPSPAATAVFTNRAGDEVSLLVEIADEPDERSLGLMFRESMPENSGMLFLYENDHRTGFWMKDTLIPLSIAFVAADGSIIDIQDMEPETTESHKPPASYRNAIEANQGWFERNGVAVGDTVALRDS